MGFINQHRNKVDMKEKKAVIENKNASKPKPELSEMEKRIQARNALAVKAKAEKTEAEKLEAENAFDKEDTVDDLKTDLESQGEKADESAGTVDELSDDLDGVKDDIGSLENRVDDVEYDIEKIKEKLQDDSEFIGNPELETNKAILAASIDEMLNVEDIEDRKAYKAEAIVKLEAFVNGYVSSAAKYPNIVAVWFMIWLFDLGDIARALPLALHLAKQKIHNMPTRFKSEIETFICDQMYDWANAKLDANKSAGPYLDDLIKTIESDKWQLPDVVHGKMYAMYGKHLDALAEDEPALKAYEKAMELNPRAGVKKNIQKLRAKLKV